MATLNTSLLVNGADVVREIGETLGKGLLDAWIGEDWNTWTTGNWDIWAMENLDIYRCTWTIEVVGFLHSVNLFLKPVP